MYSSHFICCFSTLISINGAHVLLCNEELLNPDIQMLTHVLFYAIAPKNYQCKLTVVAWMSRDGG